MTDLSEPSKGTLSGIDLEGLRLPSGGLDSVSTKKILNIVPVKRPNKQEFFRIKSGDEWVFQTMVLELKEDRETYIVSPALFANLEQEIKPVCLYTAYTRRGDFFLIPVMLPRMGKQNSWHESLQQAVNEAKSAWVRAVPNQSLGGYDIVEALGAIREPALPEDVAGITQLLPIAFRNKVVDTLDHPIVKRLEGSI